VAFRADTAMIRPRWNLEPGTWNLESDDELCGPPILAMRFFLMYWMVALPFPPQRECALALKNGETKKISGKQESATKTSSTST